MLSLAALLGAIRRLQRRQDKGGHVHWYFREQEAGEQTRDPIVGEFFSTDAIENPAEALVREGIQNALDAATGNQIRIRIRLAIADEALTPETWMPWLSGAWDHINADRNGIRKKPGPSERCPFLVFEDFGTSGLNGNTAQPFDEPDTRNPFFYFFRAEGRSGKSEGDRGRWGIGKHVFPRSSDISSFFGLSVRSEDHKKILMGRTILKTHKIGTTHFCPDGYFGELEGKFSLPISSEVVHNRFANDFQLSRTTEPGLSIVVPFIDPDFTFDYLVSAVLHDYFYPILKNQLVVSLSSGSRSIVLEAATINEAAISHALPEVVANILLAKAALEQSNDKIFDLLPCEEARPAWDEALIPQDCIEKLRETLSQGQLIGLRAHLTVREKSGGTTRPSHFNVFLRQDGCESGRPVFVREGIIISDVRGPRTRGVRSLVTIEDKPIATLLGDSENPAHTQWQKDSSNFKGKYVYGPSHIEFVTKFVHNFVLALQTNDNEINRTILSDFFFLPPEDQSDQTTRPQNVANPEAGDATKAALAEIEPTKKRFRLKRVDGGFSIVRGDAGTQPPAKIHISLAYDVRRGNPLKKYSTADFRVQSQPIMIHPETQNIVCTTFVDNHIVAEIRSSEFNLTLVGFDKNRDLFIKARMEEETNAAEI